MRYSIKEQGVLNIIKMNPTGSIEQEKRRPREISLRKSGIPSKSPLYSALPRDSTLRGFCVPDTTLFALVRSVLRLSSFYAYQLSFL